MALPDLTQETDALAGVLKYLGFYDDTDRRIELEMPFPEPIAQHLARRGVRYNPELAVVKPSRNERGEQIWVALDEPVPQEVSELTDSPEALSELKERLETMLAKIDEAQHNLDARDQA